MPQEECDYRVNFSPSEAKQIREFTNRLKALGVEPGIINPQTSKDPVTIEFSAGEAAHQQLFADRIKFGESGTFSAEACLVLSTRTNKITVFLDKENHVLGATGCGREDAWLDHFAKGTAASRVDRQIPSTEEQLKENDRLAKRDKNGKIIWSIPQLPRTVIVEFNNAKATDCGRINPLSRAANALKSLQKRFNFQ
jgi:hypothetical protein